MYNISAYWLLLNMFMLTFVIAELNKALIRNDELVTNASNQNVQSIVNELLKGPKMDQSKETSSLELKSENDNLNKKLDQVKLFLENFKAIKADFNKFLKNHEETYGKIKEIKTNFENF
jgi:hypothetical protein